MSKKKQNQKLIVSKAKTQYLKHKPAMKIKFLFTRKRMTSLGSDKAPS